MGRITIDIPQHLEAGFRVIEKELASDLLAGLRSRIGLSNAVDPGEISGIWSGLDETPDQIAARLRKSWRRKLLNG